MRMKTLFNCGRFIWFLTIGGRSSLVKDMKISDKILNRLIHHVFRELKSNNVITFKEKEEKVADRALQVLKKDLAREAELDAEVHRMLDDIERQNPGEFQRFKMFPLLKKRLAKEKGVVL